MMGHNTMARSRVGNVSLWSRQNKITVIGSEHQPKIGGKPINWQIIDWGIRGMWVLVAVAYIWFIRMTRISRKVYLNLSDQARNTIDSYRALRDNNMEEAKRLNQEAELLAQEGKRLDKLKPFKWF
jgi:hypothetical protein